MASSTGATLTASSAQLSAQTEKLSERVGAIAEALDVVVGRLQAMQTPDRVFEMQLEPVIAALMQAVERIAGQSDARAAFSSHFANGLAVVDFQWNETQGSYLLEPYED